MALGGKLLALLSIGQALYGKWMLRRLAVGVIIIGWLIFITSILGCALLICCLYTLYVALLSHGMDALEATVTVTATLMLVTAVFAAVTYAYAASLRRLPKKLLRESPLTAKATEAVDAFLDGFLQEDKEKE